MTDGMFLIQDPLDPQRAAELAIEEAANADLADAVRAMVDACVRTRLQPEDVGAVATRVRQLTAELLAVAQEGPLGLEVTSDGRLRDHGNPAVGARNPIAPPLRIIKDAAAGRCETNFDLGAAYEGPPGHIHGGVIALILDQMLGTVPALIGKPGMTASLSMAYKRPSPLGPGSAKAWVESVDGWKTQVRGCLMDAEGRTTVTADGLFIVPKWARDKLSSPQSDAGDFSVPNPGA
ncbi:PaaI family thioesterase [Gephyromycinifex aptenodytis]|uniref:PaaI family thioesterase n=1 Tax=Gephyromycinifex aptenodytis TaxID=2716227 RepID=UPI001445D0A9|nr:PaaI family thioesterase [Gephyromycinifex aptenodytis]